MEGGGVESSVVERDGVQAGDAFVADDAATAQAVELYDCLVRGLNGAEGLEKAGVGILAELIEAPEVGSASVAAELYPITGRGRYATAAVARPIASESIGRGAS